jgi:hypothetical protein
MFQNPATRSATEKMAKKFYRSLLGSNSILVKDKTHNPKIKGFKHCHWHWQRKYGKEKSFKLYNFV